MLTQTFNGCARSELSVTPTNWDKKNATVKKPWKIHYRFYDPSFKGTRQWGKQVAIRGMNEYNTLEDRQKACKILRDEELDKLDKQGYNPVTNQYMAAAEQLEYDISPDTMFIDALNAAYKKLDCIPDVLTDIRSIINGVDTAAGQLVDMEHRTRYKDLPIKEIRRKHLKHILERCSKINERWSNNRHNVYIAYLSMLFAQLVEAEAVESNWVRDIPKKKKTKKVKKLLTSEEQKMVDDHLKKNHYRFWRYMRIFFRSGSRTTEMLSLQKNDKIDLEKQEFIVTVKKGKHYSESVRPIPNDVLPLWLELWDEAKPGDYLFSRLLKPGPKKIGKSQPGRRWTKYVKNPKEEGGLGIDKNFYWLKSLHTDTVAAREGLAHAQASTGHTTQKMTLVYAIGEHQRKLDKLKELEVKFGA